MGSVLTFINSPEQGGPETSLHAAGKAPETEKTQSFRSFGRDSGAELVLGINGIEYRVSGGQLLADKEACAVHGKLLELN